MSSKSHFFEPLNNTVALVAQSGGYTEAPLYTYDGKVFARLGASYHRLLASAAVSGTRKTWIAVHGDEAHRITTGKIYVEVKAPVAMAA